MNLRSTTSRLAVLCLVLLALGACKRQEPGPGTMPADTGAAVPPAVETPAVQAPAIQAPGPGSPPAAGPEQPSLRVTTIDGKPYDLAKRRGNWVVVNFWATWCGPCLKEMPELSALDAMREHVEVIGLAYQDIEPGELRAFLEKHPVVYPIAIVDTYDPPGDFATPRGLPTTYLISPDGRIVKHFLGPVTAGDVDAAIAAAGGPKPG